VAWLEWLGNLPHAELLRRFATLYLFVNAAHILGIGLLLGAILPLDLRLIGVLREGPMAVLAPFLVRVAAAGLAIAVLTGLMLFSVKPLEYADNPALWAKLGLITLGMVNVVIQHRARGWDAVRRGAEPGATVRMLAATSFAIWLATLVAGRWIGFV
jgi:hypothetical protein